MKCPECQFDNLEEAKFCTECGCKLEVACPECGYNLATIKKAPSIDFAKPTSYTPRFLADRILTLRSSIEGEKKL